MEVVPDEHEGVRETQRAKACGERDLRCLVDDAVVELAAEEKRTAKKININHRATIFVTNTH